MSICVFVCLSVCPYHRKTPTFEGKKLILTRDDTLKLDGVAPLIADPPPLKLNQKAKFTHFHKGSLSQLIN